MVVVVVVMIVLVVVVDGVCVGCDSVGDCVLFPFISYVFESSFYLGNIVICQSTKNKTKQQQRWYRRLVCLLSDLCSTLRLTY